MYFKIITKPQTLVANNAEQAEAIAKELSPLPVEGVKEITHEEFHQQ